MSHEQEPRPPQPPHWPHPPRPSEPSPGVPEKRKVTVEEAGRNEEELLQWVLSHTPDNEDED